MDGQQTSEVKQKDGKEQGLSGSTLKILAVVTMLIDHIGAGFIEMGMLPYLAQTYGVGADVVNTWSVIDTVMRCVGRMAFPIFCFLLVEGYFNTRSVRKYLGRLFVFALISEVPFDLAFSGTIVNAASQNVFFSLFLGLAAIAICDHIRADGWRYKLLTALTLIGLGIAATVANTDYSFVAILLIYVFYAFRGQELAVIIAGAVALLGAGAVEVAGYVAFLPIHYYNGKRGFQLKYIFYAFYPVHLLLIALVRMAVYGG